MILTVLAFLSLAFATIPALLYWRNIRLFQPPPLVTSPLPYAVSVLIPARNETRSIAAAVESVLVSRFVDLELIVLDDHSEDDTAAIVREMAAKDARLRLESAPPLPPGWNGKQHACQTLAGLARFSRFAFLDADVRLEPDGLARMIAFQEQSQAGLVSGFPRQETGTFLERLVIPLIHLLLLGYLPLHRMRSSSHPSYGAGCGQWFVTTRGAYEQAGGHEAIRQSRHDGLALPRAYRKAGLVTDVCDATELARCRMYHSASEVWLGLAKNAREGLAAPKLLPVTTLMLFCGHVLPFALLLALPVMTPLAAACTLVAVGASYAPRFASAGRFRQSWLGALLHPVGVTILLAIQWYATVRAWAGVPVDWKGRPPVTDPVLLLPPGRPSP